MNISTAVSEARKLKNFFSAFEKLEEVLKMASSSEAIVSQNEKTVADLKREQERIQSAISAAQAAFEKFSEQSKEDRKRMNEANRKRQAEISEQQKGLAAEISAAEISHKDKLQKNREEFDSLVKERNAELASLTAKIEDAKKQLELIRKKVA